MLIGTIEVYAERSENGGIGEKKYPKQNGARADLRFFVRKHTLAWGVEPQVYNPGKKDREFEPRSRNRRILA